MLYCHVAVLAFEEPSLTVICKVPSSEKVSTFVPEGSGITDIRVASHVPINCATGLLLWVVGGGA